MANQMAEALNNAKSVNSEVKENTVNNDMQAIIDAAVKAAEERLAAKYEAILHEQVTKAVAEVKEYKPVTKETSLSRKLRNAINTSVEYAAKPFEATEVKVRNEGVDMVLNASANVSEKLDVAFDKASTYLGGKAEGWRARAKARADRRAQAQAMIAKA